MGKWLRPGSAVRRMVWLADLADSRSLCPRLRYGTCLSTDC